MDRRAADVSRQFAAIGILAAFVAFGCFAWADTGWFGERMPDTIRAGNARGDYFHDGDDASMVYVPAGYFLRGTTKARAEALSRQFGDFFMVETPQRSIYLSAYYIDKFEVTNRQYGVFLDALKHGDRHPLHPDAPPDKNYTPTYWRDSRLNGPEHPVTAVDWYDAYAYCRWAGKELPTEAQWEKTARGPDGLAYPWGDTWQVAYSNNVESTFGNPILDDRQWILLLGNLDLDTLAVFTQPVGSFPEGISPYGAHDMGGNLWEWARDRYIKDYYHMAPSHDPPGPTDASPYRVLRGGCWSSHRGKIRAAYRNYDLAADRHLEIGFRCALAAE
jgi:formylglycine-generating enzyme required for sulfatase activity